MKKKYKKDHSTSLRYTAEPTAVIVDSRDLSLSNDSISRKVSPNDHVQFLLPQRKHMADNSSSRFATSFKQRATAAVTTSAPANR